MEEIKVGDYIRTHKGKIYKVTNVYVLKVTCGHTSLRYTDISKHSPNIIDLIEVGDYVNGYLVTRVCNEEPCPSGKWVDIDCDRPSEFCTLWETDIKSIVTKEQFKAMEYEVNHASNIT